MCIFCKKLSIAIYDDHDAEMLESLLNNMEEDCEGLVDTYRAILWLDMQKAEDNDDYEHIISKGNELLRDYPDDI